ncbi:ATP-binding protein [Kitasatospora cineracea]|uniref:ATP-binding protein n=1 Tax=Kitasatospora cineracea TaxID=88074 RepID=UPI0036890501
MSNFTFAPATREQAKARIALAGPSGSGKTFTALSMATAMSPRVALIDTERGSASKYAASANGAGFTFDTLQMHKYDPRDLVGALAAAGQAGYGAVIVDSLSHFWMGTGGMLELVDAIGKRGGGGGNFGGWKEARPFERAMIDALLAYPGHVIVTMRTKTEYVVEEDNRGKKQVRKVGLKAEQRDGIEYEFDIIGDLDQENTLVISKTRCPELSGAVINRPGEDMAATVLAWLQDGAEVPDSADLVAKVMADGLTYEGALAIHEEAKRHRLLGAAVVHPLTQVSLSLGELIVERGRQLRAAGRPLSVVPGPSQSQSSMPGSGTTAAGATGPAAEPGSREQAIDRLRAAALGADMADQLEEVFAQSYGVAIAEAPLGAIREMTAKLESAA